MPKEFPLEKILTISAREYCEMHGKKLRDFKAVGVHYRGYAPEHMEAESINDIVPRGTEVVVNYSASISRQGCNFAYFEHGTALIPKKRPIRSA